MCCKTLPPPLPPTHTVSHTCVRTKQDCMASDASHDDASSCNAAMHLALCCPTPQQLTPYSLQRLLHHHGMQCAGVLPCSDASCMAWAMHAMHPSDPWRAPYSPSGSPPMYFPSRTLRELLVGFPSTPLMSSSDPSRSRIGVESGSAPMFRRSNVLSRVKCWRDTGSRR